MKAITKHYIDGAFVESHGREVMDSINPTNGQVIARVALGDEEDARRAIAAAKRAFASFGRTTKEERMEILRRLHKAVSARTDDFTKTMIEEYGGVVQFAAPIVQAGADVFLSAEKALRELPLTRSWGKTTVTFLDDQQAPFGGFKHSGVGREFGTFGIEAFLEPRAILE
jgi:aldehyde dehydrogenase (NAD+)